MTTVDWMKENFNIVSYIVAALFFVGGAYAEFQYLQAEIEHLSTELERVEKELGKLESEVDGVHLYIEYHKGYLEGNQ